MLRQVLEEERNASKQAEELVGAGACVRRVWCVVVCEREGLWRDLPQRRKPASQPASPLLWAEIGGGRCGLACWPGTVWLLVQRYWHVKGRLLSAIPARLVAHVWILHLLPVVLEPAYPLSQQAQVAS